MNARYYCHRCADKYHLVTRNLSAEPFGTPYKKQKFLKHTTPNTTYEIVSIFSDQSTQAYKGYVLSAAASGCVQVDSLGRVNMMWVADKPPGVTLVNGKFQASANVVILALPHDADRLHAIPWNIPELPCLKCQLCGVPIVAPDLEDITDPT